LAESDSTQRNESWWLAPQFIVGVLVAYGFIAVVYGFAMPWWHGSTAVAAQFADMFGALSRQFSCSESRIECSLKNYRCNARNW
jgi:protein-S-isoprenylcysteine O-methyltransferase Ste14